MTLTAVWAGPVLVVALLASMVGLVLILAGIIAALVTRSCALALWGLCVTAGAVVLAFGAELLGNAAVTLPHPDRARGLTLATGVAVLAWRLVVYLTER